MDCQAVCVANWEIYEVDLYMHIIELPSSAIDCIAKVRDKRSSEYTQNYLWRNVNTTGDLPSSAPSTRTYKITGIWMLHMPQIWGIGHLRLGRFWCMFDSKTTSNNAEISVVTVPDFSVGFSVVRSQPKPNRPKFIKTATIGLLD